MEVDKSMGEEDEVKEDDFVREKYFEEVSDKEKRTKNTFEKQVSIATFLSVARSHVGGISQGPLDKKLSSTNAFYIHVYTLQLQYRERSFSRRNVVAEARAARAVVGFAVVSSRLFLEEDGRRRRARATRVCACVCQRFVFRRLSVSLVRVPATLCLSRPSLSPSSRRFLPRSFCDPL